MNAPKPHWQRERERRQSERESYTTPTCAAAGCAMARQADRSYCASHGLDVEPVKTGWYAHPDKPKTQRYWDHVDRQWINERPTPRGNSLRVALIVGALVVVVIGAGVGVIALIVHAVGGSSGGASSNYKTITCEQWRKKAGAKDALSNGSLDIALKYAEAVNVIPSGFSGSANFGDVISGACGPTRLNNTPIFDLRDQVRSVYLELHPGDAEGS